MSAYAPSIFTIQINPERIGEIIGPGGKTIKKITAETGAQIDIQQRFQSFSATLTVPGLAAPVAVFDGRVSANTLLAPGATNMPVARLQLDGVGLRLISAVGAAARFEGGRFTASSQGSCP